MGQLHTLPAITASFVASGPAGSVQNQIDTEYLVDTNVTDILNINVAFDGYPTAGQVAEPTLPPYRGTDPSGLPHHPPVGDRDLDQQRQRRRCRHRRPDRADHRLGLHQRRR